MSKLTAPGTFGGQTLKTYVSVDEKAFAESHAELPSVNPSGAGSSPLTAVQAMPAARDKRKHEDQPKVKTVSTGKTDALLAGLSSPETSFFTKKKLKEMYPPDSGSSAYTVDSPVPKTSTTPTSSRRTRTKKPLPSPAPSMHTAVYSDGDSPASSSSGSSAGSAEVM